MTEYEIKWYGMAWYTGYVHDYHEGYVYVTYPDDLKPPEWIDITSVRYKYDSSLLTTWRPSENEEVECETKWYGCDFDETEPYGWWPCIVKKCNVDNGDPVSSPPIPSELYSISHIRTEDQWNDILPIDCVRKKSTSPILSSRNMHKQTYNVPLELKEWALTHYQNNTLLHTLMPEKDISSQIIHIKYLENVNKLVLIGKKRVLMEDIIFCYFERVKKVLMITKNENEPHELVDDGDGGWGFELNFEEWDSEVILQWIGRLDEDGTFYDEYEEKFEIQSVTGQNFKRDQLGNVQWCRQNLGMKPQTVEIFATIVRQRITKYENIQNNPQNIDQPYYTFPFSPNNNDLNYNNNNWVFTHSQKSMNENNLNKKKVELKWWKGTEILNRKWAKKDEIEYDSDPEHKRKDNKSHIHHGIILKVDANKGDFGKIMIKDESGSYGQYGLEEISIKLPNDYESDTNQTNDEQKSMEDNNLNITKFVTKYVNEEKLKVELKTIRQKYDECKNDLINSSNKNKGLQQKIADKDVKMKEQNDIVEAAIHKLSDTRQKGDEYKQQLKETQIANNNLQQMLKELRAKYKLLSDERDTFQDECKEITLKYNEMKIEYDKQQRKLLLSGNYTNWDSKDIVEWLCILENGRYNKYKSQLSMAVKQESIKGTDLMAIDTSDLHRFGITGFGDKKRILNHIKNLNVQHKNDGDVEGGDATLYH